MSSPLAVHLLDVGDRQYGDAILCLIEGISILIDGGHPSDGDLIQQQLARILGKTAVDLLIITHCHADHIGCLPSLICQGTLSCSWALLADPEFGFGAPVDPRQPTQADLLRAALREEVPTDASDDEIRSVIEDAMNIRADYEGLVSHFRSRLGARVVLYRGPDEDVSPGLNELKLYFAPASLGILGPSHAQLEICAEQVRRFAGRSLANTASELASLPEDHGEIVTQALVARYRELTQYIHSDSGNDLLEDAGGLGAIVNNQSLICAIGPPTSRILLTGDMQLSAPGGPSELKREVAALRGAIAHAGPFGYVKLPHHGSANGANNDLLDDWGSALFGISTGARSGHHPSPGVLNLLKERGARWVRTDLNGLSSARWDDTAVNLTVARGSISDARTGGAHPPAASPQSTPRIVRRPVECRTDLPDLLFVTDLERLTSAIGSAGAAAVRARLNNSRVAAPNLHDIQTLLREQPSIAGVVLVGGPSVVPPISLDTLPSRARAYATHNDIRDISDDFKVWTDDDYATAAGNPSATHPISRIPDCGDAEFVLACLDAPRVRPIQTGSGIRNIERPYAHAVFSAIPDGRLLTSDPTRHDADPAYDLEADLIYLALHMNEDDGSEAHGQSDSGSWPVAIRCANIPDVCPPVVVSGCCWSALTTGRSLYEDADRKKASPRRIHESLALTCLASGANAFIGCTGSHPPPQSHPWRYLAGPLHFALFDRLLSGEPPARALWLAKRDYSGKLPYSDRFDLQFREYKVSRMFTCLGLGW